MTPQQIFDKVAVHLMEMDKPSKFDGGCAYRGEDNSQCAVGCLIDDEHYEKRMEGKPVDALISHYGHTLPSFFVKNLNLFVSLQHTHDFHFHKRYYKLMVISRIYNLDLKVLEKYAPSR